MITITWKIDQLDRRTEDGFVTTAHWRCTGVDGDAIASIYSTCGFDGELAIPYENLTEEQVLSWVWASVDKEATESAIEAQVELQKNPPTQSGTPWA